MCGGSNLSTVLLLWGIYIKKCISPVRICPQTRNARNASTKFRKTSESKKAEKSLEISVFLLFSCLHLNQTLIMAGIAGFEPANAGVKVLCLDRLGYIPIKRQNKPSLMREALRILRQLSVRYFHDIIYQFSYLVKLKENRQRLLF